MDFENKKEERTCF